MTQQMSRTRRWWFWVWVITAAGLAARVAYILVFRSDPMLLELPQGGFIETEVGGDGLVFHQQANLIADGEGLVSPLNLMRYGIHQQSADHPPLYTGYLTFWSLLGFRGTITHMLLSAPLGALAATTFAMLGRRLAGPAVGIVAALIGAFAPSIIHYPGFLLSEAVTIPLAALAAWALIGLVDEPSHRRAVLVGVTIGAAILARAELAIYVLVAIIPVTMLIRSLPPWQRFVRLSIAGACCAALLLPWVAWNLTRFENPVLLSIGLEYSLVQANCGEAYSDRMLGYYWLPCMHEALEGETTEDGTPLAVADQSVHSPFLRDVAIDYIRDHPGRATQALFARVGRITGTFRPLQQARLDRLIAGREAPLANTTVLTFYPAVVLAAVGAVITARRRRPLWPLLGLALTSVIAVAMTLAVLRYRASAEPAIAVFASVALVSGWRFVRRAWEEPDAAGDPP